MHNRHHSEIPTAPSPFECINQCSPDGILLICDHASRHIPPAYGDLGVSPEHLRSHIAWDIGAGELTRRMASLLGAGAVLSRVSRLVIDCNRPPGHQSSIPAATHAVAVPGNLNLPPRETQARERQFFYPYQSAIAAKLSAIEESGTEAVLVSVHSFTPFLNTVARPWHFGVLSDRDPRLADLVLTELKGQPDLVIGDNEPYSGSNPEGYACRYHGDAKGRANVLIEVRQDLVNSPTRTNATANLLAPAIARATAQLREEKAK